MQSPDAILCPSCAGARALAQRWGSAALGVALLEVLLALLTGQGVLAAAGASIGGGTAVLVGLYHLRGAELARVREAHMHHDLTALSAQLETWRFTADDLLFSADARAGIALERTTGRLVLLERAAGTSHLALRGIPADTACRAEVVLATAERVTDKQETIRLVTAVGIDIVADGMVRPTRVLAFAGEAPAHAADVTAARHACDRWVEALAMRAAPEAASAPVPPVVAVADDWAAVPPPAPIGPKPTD